MKKLAITLVANGISLFLIGILIPGISIRLDSLVILTLVFWFLNSIVGPILKILSFPITIMTLGLFIFVINGLVFFWAFKAVPGAECSSFFLGIVASIVLAIINSVVIQVLKKK